MLHLKFQNDRCSGLVGTKLIVFNARAVKPSSYLASAGATKYQLRKCIATTVKKEDCTLDQFSDIFYSSKKLVVFNVSIKIILFRENAINIIKHIAVERFITSLLR